MADTPDDEPTPDWDDDESPFAEPDGNSGYFNPDAVYVRCALAQILATDPPDPTYVVVLRSLEDDRAFPIHIGGFEWQAIHRPVHGLTTPRPLTHDLMLACLEALSARLVEVRVRDLIEDEEGDGTFFGSLVIDHGDERMEIDCRPSDALALSARTDCPIMVAERVLEKLAGPVEPDGD